MDNPVFVLCLGIMYDSENPIKYIEKINGITN